MKRTLKVNEAVVCAGLDDEAVLLDVDNGIYYGIDGVGTRIWKLLEQEYGEEAIVYQLLEEYDVELVELRSDVARFLAELEARGLVLTANENE